jgi:hypothetical protein
LTTALTLETYTFGLSRSTGKMRFRREGEADILVDRLVGQWWVKDCDRDGNIHAECAIDIREDHQYGRVAYLYHPDVELMAAPEAASEMCGLPETDNRHDTCHIASQVPYPNGRSSHFRCCYARELAVQTQDPCWRFRDERTGELWFINGYRGPMNVNWFDHGTHVFFDGVAHVDEDLICWFSEEEK